MTRAREASALWTIGLVVCASIALVGITAFMMRVHREAWREPVGRSARARAAMPPAERHREVPAAAGPEVPTASPAIQGPIGAALAAGATTDAAIAWLRARNLSVPVSGLDTRSIVPSFSQARGTRVHEALDIMAAAGTPVIAVEDGTVARLFTSDSGGLTIYQFDPTRSVAYYYAHLQGYAPGLSEGDAVSRGEVIGYVGSTGNARADAPHLHFAIFVLGPERRWWEGTAIDPYPVFR